MRVSDIPFPPNIHIISISDEPSTVYTKRKTPGKLKSFQKDVNHYLLGIKWKRNTETMSFVSLIRGMGIQLTDNGIWFL